MNQKLSLLFNIVANLSVLLGVVFWHWDITLLLLFYWFEAAFLALLVIYRAFAEVNKRSVISFIWVLWISYAIGGTFFYAMLFFILLLIAGIDLNSSTWEVNLNKVFIDSINVIIIPLIILGVRFVIDFIMKIRRRVSIVANQLMMELAKKYGELFIIILIMYYLGEYYIGNEVPLYIAFIIVMSVKVFVDYYLDKKSLEINNVEKNTQ